MCSENIKDRQKSAFLVFPDLTPLDSVPVRTGPSQTLSPGLAAPGIRELPLKQADKGAL